jgi:hypothetical protein
MKIAALLGIILTVAVLRGDTEPKVLAHRILSQSTERIDSLTKLPPSIRNALTEKIGVIADRGEAFAEGCTDDGAPRRFIQAGRTPGYWWIHYESGGRAHSSSVIIFEVRDQKVIFTGECYTGLFAPDFERLLQSIKPNPENRK